MRNIKFFEPYRTFTNESLLALARGKYNIETDGEFLFPTKKDEYFVGVCTSFGWEHIMMAVFTEIDGKWIERIPGTSELEAVKRMFFPGETVFEVHPRKKDYVNIDCNMLHLWRPTRQPLHLPPKIEEFSSRDIIAIPNSELSLLVQTARSEGWECYEVSILKSGTKVRRKPSWDEMCVAKRCICGEDEVALQYHIDNDGTGAYSIRLWIPPKTLNMPLPEPYLVGIRNDEDRKAYRLRLQQEEMLTKKK